MILSIQFLRAAAALMVLGFHAVYTANVYAGYSFAFNNAGAAGVDVFFVISGFIITYVTRAGADSPARFLMRRLIRIAPPYWFYTTVTVCILLAMPSAYSHLKFDFEHVLFSFLFLLSANNVNAVGTVLGVGWSICYEMYFYLLFAAFMLVPKRFAMAGMACVILLGALLEHVVAVPPFAQVALSALPLEFLAGCLLAKCYLRGVFLPRAIAIAAVAGGCALIYWSGTADVVASGRDSWRVVYFGLPAICVVAGLLSLDARGWIRFPRLAISIGDASYSLYLSHQFLLFAIGKGWKMLGLHERLPAIAFLTVAVTISVFAGMLAYRWFERPVTRWLNQAWQAQHAAIA
jgi:exopolysaccharide production protein ExoZ